MKILHIFGAVVAVHLAVFLIIFAVPGCRTTGKPTRPASAADSAAAAPPSATTTGESSTAALSPSATPDPVESALNPTVAFNPTTPVRFSPTRPNSPLANAVQPQTPVNVTPAATYIVAKGDSLWKIAQKHGLSVAELASANGLSSKASLKQGQKLIVSAKVPAGAGDSGKTGSAAGEPSSPVHEVKSGESLGVIAKMYGTTTGTLKRLNALRSDTVRVGQKLALPEGPSGPATGVSAKIPSPPVSRSATAFKHAVKAGETLGAIAKKYGISVGEVATANNISDPAKIRLGQELIIPGWSAPKTAEPSGPFPVPATPAQPSPFEPITPADGKTDGPPKSANPGEVPIIRIEDAPPAPPSGSGETPRIP